MSILKIKRYCPILNNSFFRKLIPFPFIKEIHTRYRGCQFLHSATFDRFIATFTGTTPITFFFSIGIGSLLAPVIFSSLPAFYETGELMEYVPVGVRTF